MQSVATLSIHVGRRENRRAELNKGRGQGRDLSIAAGHTEQAAQFTIGHRLFMIGRVLLRLTMAGG